MDYRPTLTDCLVASVELIMTGLNAVQLMRLLTSEKNRIFRKVHPWLYNLEKVLNFSSRHKKSLNPFKVIKKYLISVDSRLSDFPYLLN